MASPQVENGYTKIANELLDALASHRLAGQEYQVVLFIIRKTYGFGKKCDLISMGQISDGTGISRPHIAEILKGLYQKNIISVAENSNSSVNCLYFSKDYEKWKVLPKRGTVTEKRNTLLRKSGTRVFRKSVHTKEKKETFTKESISLTDLPEHERAQLELLKGIPGYPFKIETDLPYLREKSEQFPAVDIESLLRAWKAYILDAPFKPKSKPRAQLHKQFELAMQWGKHQKAADAGLPEPENMVLKIRAEREKRERGQNPAA